MDAFFLNKDSYLNEELWNEAMDSYTEKYKWIKWQKFGWGNAEEALVMFAWFALIAVLFSILEVIPFTAGFLDDVGAY